MASMVPPLKLDTGSAIRLDHASFVWKDQAIIAPCVFFCTSLHQAL